MRGHGNGILPEAERLIHLPRGHGEALVDAWANLYAEAGLAIAARRGDTLSRKAVSSFPELKMGLKVCCSLMLVPTATKLVGPGCR